MTPENWNQVVMDAYRAVGWVGIAYLMPLFLIGHYIIETLFLVIMLRCAQVDPSPALL